MNKYILILMLFLLTVKIYYPNGRVETLEACILNNGHILQPTCSIKLLDGTWRTIPKRWVTYWGTQETAYGLILNDKGRWVKKEDI